MHNDKTRLPKGRMLSVAMLKDVRKEIKRNEKVSIKQSKKYESKVKQ